MNYYTMKCHDWAKRFAMNRPGSTCLRITAYNKDLCMGGILQPNGEMRTDPPWFEHWVVYYAGRIHDQAYSHGISPQEYKKKFEYWDMLSFPPGCGF